MKIYITSADNAHSLLDRLLTERLGSYEMLKNEFGKPYVRGNEIFFNLSHSGNSALVAISDKPVGCDIEEITGRCHEKITERFCDAERAEIHSEADFLVHFTAREAYVKNIGGSLFEMYRKLTFVGGYIRVNGEKQDEKITSFVRDNCVFTVCGDGEIEIINE